jgi:glycosyltransferase involved in cell wall biosynthesis
VDVIVPTYNEAENIPELARRLFAIAAKHALELSVLVVDDGSPDGTAEVVRREAAKYPGRLRILERRGERGLAVSVIDGLAQTSAPMVLVMDADLSHRPEEIPALLAPIRGGHADLLVGSRYIEGGSTEDGWGLLRRLNSSAAVLLARALTPLSDPMSGFFAFSRAVLEKAPHLNPTGYKILLELLVKTRPVRVLEVPIRFEKRGRGKSKLTLREQLLYLRHLGRLHAHAFPRLLELARFAAVGASARPFLRADANGDGSRDVSDPVFSLNFLFTGGPAPGCLDAADANDDGEIDISDPVFSLFAFFAGGGPIPPPYPGAGADPTADGLTCAFTDANPGGCALPPFCELSGSNDPEWCTVIVTTPVFKSEWYASKDIQIADLDLDGDLDFFVPQSRGGPCQPDCVYLNRINDPSFDIVVTAAPVNHPNPGVPLPGAGQVDPLFNESAFDDHDGKGNRLLADTDTSNPKFPGIGLRNFYPGHKIRLSPGAAYCLRPLWDDFQDLEGSGLEPSWL